VAADVHLLCLFDGFVTGACVQSTLTAAAAGGLDVAGDEHRWDGPWTTAESMLAIVYDPATRMFWRNVRARVSVKT
jgi:hypothetical protein